jgi:ferredoxin
VTGEPPDGSTAGVGESSATVRLTVVDDRGGREPATLSVPRGANLRESLLAAGYSPYTRLTERTNCGGRGLCATCGVRFVDGSTDGVETGAEDGGSTDPLPPCEPPAPDHWHDRLAARFGYPRLSCQVACDRDLTVRIPTKLVWGGRE